MIYLVILWFVIIFNSVSDHSLIVIRFSFYKKI